MTAHAWILVLLLIGVLKLFGTVPFEQEIRQAIGYALPWTPWIIMAIILSRAAGGAVNTVTTWIDKLISLIAAIIYGIAFTAIVVPTMVGDILLLGPLAMWALKQTPVLIASVVVNGFVYWFLTMHIPTTIPKKYIVGALTISVSLIFVLYASQWLLNTHWISFEAKNGVFLPDPVVSVEVKGGDTIRFAAFGYNVVNKLYPAATGTGSVSVNEIYPPEGLTNELYKDPTDPKGWPRPDGETQLLVEQPSGAPTVVRLKSLESGPGQIFGVDFKDITGGYYIAGMAEIPKSIGKGRLGVEFFNITPIEGKFRMTVVHNLGESLSGRLLMAFVLGEGFKHFKKKDYITGGRVFFILFGIGMLVGGIVQYGRKPEGLHVHWWNIFCGIVSIGVAWYIVELLLDGSSPRIMIEDFWRWASKKK